MTYIHLQRRRCLRVSVPRHVRDSGAVFYIYIYTYTQTQMPCSVHRYRYMYVEYNKKKIIFHTYTCIYVRVVYIDTGICMYKKLYSIQIHTGVCILYSIYIYTGICMLYSIQIESYMYIKNISNIHTGICMLYSI